MGALAAAMEVHTNPSGPVTCISETMNPAQSPLFLSEPFCPFLHTERERCSDSLTVELPRINNMAHSVWKTEPAYFGNIAFLEKFSWNWEAFLTEMNTWKKRHAWKQPSVSRSCNWVSKLREFAGIWISVFSNPSTIFLMKADLIRHVYQ